MARSRPGFFRRFLTHTARFFNDESADFVADRLDRAAGRARQFWRDVKNRGRHIYDGKSFRSIRELNAYHLARNGGYWAGQKARVAGRKIGKARDAARRHARGHREAAGLIDHMGRRTPRGASRPELQGRVSIRELRQAHRHDRHHERAIRRDHRADRAEARGRDARAAAHRERAAGLRDRWPERARTVPAAANGTRPEPARTAPAPAPARTAPADGNGTRPARPPRTR